MTTEGFNHVELGYLLMVNQILLETSLKVLVEKVALHKGKHPSLLEVRSVFTLCSWDSWILKRFLRCMI